jgi:hypothetical protein
MGNKQMTTTRAKKRPAIETLEIQNERLQFELQHTKGALKNAEQMLEHIPEHPIESVKAAKNAALRSLEAKIIKAFAEVDETEIIKQIEVRICNEVQEVSDKLLGVDRRWHEMSLTNGKITQVIGGAVDSIVDETLKPLVVAEVKRLLSLQSFKKLIDNSIKERTQSAIRSLSYGNSSISSQIDDLVKKELNAALAEYMSVSEEYSCQ